MMPPCGSGGPLASIPASLSAAALASYLLFEPDFIHALMELGEHDAWRRKDELLAFFRAPQPVDSAVAVP